jgi:uncharacterized membrane protein YjgN (DUF898 family)
METTTFATQRTLTTHRLSFTGSAGEYFKIWLVNTALTIITLGIYGAWAKVRREQYFHAHTVLDGHCFDYTANAWSILKGRILVLVLFMIIGVVGNISPALNVIMVGVLVIVMPWIITQALKFRTRYTSYRNISFRFTGSYGRTLLYFIVYPILSLFTLCTLLPLAKHRERRYVIDNLKYGTAPFKFSASVGSFYAAFLFAALLLVIPVGVFILRALMSTFFANIPAEIETTGRIVMLVSAFIAFIFIGPLLQVMLGRITWNNSAVGGFAMTYSITLGRYIWISFTNTILKLVTLGLATPYCAVRLYRYKIENLSLCGAPSLGGFIADKEQELRSFGDQAADLYDLGIDVGW